MGSFYREVSTPPSPKGSVSAFPIKRKSGKWGALVTHSAKSKKFEARVKECVADSPKLEGPIRVELWFFIARPKTVKRTYPAVAPDIDKLARAVLDALDDHYEDDSRVVDLEVYKRYATDDCPPGVWILVGEKPDGLEHEEPIREAIRQQRLASASY